jgi:MerR family mercuric resistance operon transcriptional regulator
MNGLGDAFDSAAPVHRCHRFVEQIVGVWREEVEAQNLPIGSIHNGFQPTSPIADRHRSSTVGWDASNRDVVTFAPGLSLGQTDRRERRITEDRARHPARLDSVPMYGVYTPIMKMKERRFLTIGQLAERADVGVETIRFYERKGLIAEPPRSSAGFRHYAPDAVRRVRFIRHAKALGFSLKEIMELLSLRVESDSTCADIRGRTEKKIVEVNEKIRGLKQMERALARLAASCRGEGPLSECPILDELDRDSGKHH